MAGGKGSGLGGPDRGDLGEALNDAGVRPGSSHPANAPKKDPDTSGPASTRSYAIRAPAARPDGS